MNLLIWFLVYIEALMTLGTMVLLKTGVTLKVSLLLEAGVVQEATVIFRIMVLTGASAVLWTTAVLEAAAALEATAVFGDTVVFHATASFHVTAVLHPAVVLKAPMAPEARFIIGAENRLVERLLLTLVYEWVTWLRCVEWRLRSRHVLKRWLYGGIGCLPWYWSGWSHFTKLRQFWSAIRQTPVNARPWSTPGRPEATRRRLTTIRAIVFLSEWSSRTGESPRGR